MRRVFRVAQEERTFIGRLEALHELHFQLAEVESINEVCYRAVRDGRAPTGVDRMGIWFRLPDEDSVFVGSYGVDESGGIRDERGSRIDRDTGIYDTAFFERKIPFRFFPDNTVYNDRGEVVGEADLIVAPLWNGKEAIGALSADNLLSRRRIDEFDRHLVTLLARIVAYIVTMRRTEEELRRNARQLELLATTDGLTGVLNRRTGLQLLDHAISQSRRDRRPVSVVFLDVDGLKPINDEQGHTVGDALICAVADLIGETVRDADVVCRMGGDEFMVVLPGSPREEASRVMHRLEDRAAGEPRLTDIAAGPWFSYGIAVFDPVEDSEGDADSLIQTADILMYEEKRAKRR